MKTRNHKGQLAAEENAEARIRREIAKRLEEGKPVDQVFLEECGWTKLRQRTEENAETRIRRVIAKRLEEGKPIDQVFLEECGRTKLRHRIESVRVLAKIRDKLMMRLMEGKSIDEEFLIELANEFNLREYEKYAYEYELAKSIRDLECRRSFKREDPIEIGKDRTITAKDADGMDLTKLFECDWTKLSGSDWAFLLSRHPLLAGKCDWSKLDGSDWARLLATQPQFSDKCDWPKLDRKDMAGDWPFIRLEETDAAAEIRKELAPSLREGEPIRIPKGGLAVGVDAVTMFRSGLEQRIIEGKPLDDEFLKELMVQFSGFYRRYQNEKANLYMGDWAYLLLSQPQFADKCDWAKLNADDWVRLLSEKPQFSDKCDWAKLNGSDWACLLVRQPMLAGKCDWFKLHGSAWAYLLSSQPLLANKCDWSKLNGKDFVELLSHQPLLADKIDWTKLDGSAWEGLLSVQPQFADKCDWSKLNVVDWVRLLSAQPQFADNWDWPALSGCLWADLLSHQPSFADRCDWTALSENDWGDLLYRQPQFTSKCDWAIEQDDLKGKASEGEDAAAKLRPYVYLCFAKDGEALATELRRCLYIKMYPMDSLEQPPIRCHMISSDRDMNKSHISKSSCLILLNTVDVHTDVSIMEDVEYAHSIDKPIIPLYFGNVPIHPRIKKRVTHNGYHVADARNPGNAFASLKMDTLADLIFHERIQPPPGVFID